MLLLSYLCLNECRAELKEKRKPLACAGCTNSISGTLLPGSVANGSNTCITANLTVVAGANITLTNCTLVIDPNVNITIPANTILTLNNCHVFACTSMWEGFRIDNGGRLNLINNTMVEDALTAVNLNILANPPLASTGLTIENSILNKNRVGVLISGYGLNTGVNTYGAFRITNSVITCRTIPTGTLTANLKDDNNPISAANIGLETPYINSNLFPITTLKAPYAGQIPLYGIQLQNVGATTMSSFPNANYYEIQIGSNLPAFYNVIDRHTTCLWALNTNFYCTNTVFQQSTRGIMAQLTDAGQYFRARILPSFSSLTPVTGTHVRFYNCRFAIQTNNYFEDNIQYVAIRSISATTTQTGIRLVGNRYKNYNLLRDSIFNASEGIRLTASYNPSANINGQYTQYIGDIFVRENIIQPHPNIALISQTNAKLGLGISLSNSTNFANPPGFQNPGGIRVWDNKNREVYRGIEMLNWREVSTDITDNYVKLREEPNSTAVQFGIRSDNNGGTLGPPYNHFIVNNLITGFNLTKTNVQALQSNGNLQMLVTCNTLSTTEKGILIEGTNNNMTLTRNSMSNHKYGWTLRNNAVIGNVTALNGTDPADNEWLGSWTNGNFKTLVDNANPTSSTLYVRQPNAGIYNPDGSGTVMGVGGGGGFYAMSNNSIIPVATPPALSSCPPPPPPSPPMVAEWKAWEDIADQTRTYVGDSLTVAAATYIAENGLYRLLRDNPDLQDSSAVFAKFLQIHSSSDYAICYEIETAFQSGNLDSVQFLMNNFTPTQNIATANRQYYQLYLAAQNTTLTEDDSTLLYQLAESCPYLLGRVVFNARGLYHSLNEEYILFDSDNCGGNAQRKAQTPFLSNWLIYPNPSKGEIFLSTTTLTDVAIRIFNPMGDKVMEQTAQLHNTPHKVSHNIPSGIYFIQLQNLQTHETHTEKLIVE